MVMFMSSGYNICAYIVRIVGGKCDQLARHLPMVTASRVPWQQIALDFSFSTNSGGQWELQIRDIVSPLIFVRPETATPIMCSLRRHSMPCCFMQAHLLGRELWHIPQPPWDSILPFKLTRCSQEVIPSFHSTHKLHPFFVVFCGCKSDPCRIYISFFLLQSESSFLWVTIPARSKYY